MNDQHEHIVSSYDEELQRLRREILGMGRLAAEQLLLAIQALRDGDSTLAEQVVAADDRIDAQELEVSSNVIRLLALRQPMATDLRAVLSALRIAADIERIGDHGASIARRSLALSGARPRDPIQGLTKMAEYAASMLRDVLHAFLDRDIERAMAVRESDLDLDQRYNSLLRELLTYMMEDPRNITTCAHYLFIAKNIERVGDHATNIAENVWFQTAGRLPSEARSQGDTTSIAPPA